MDGVTPGLKHLGYSDSMDGALPSDTFASREESFKDEDLGDIFSRRAESSRRLRSEREGTVEEGSDDVAGEDNVDRSPVSTFSENGNASDEKEVKQNGDKPKLSYVNDLAHLGPASFAAVTDQLHYGGLHVRHMANVLAKIAKVEEEYAKKIRATIDECHKFQHKDRILSYNSGWLNFTQQYKLCAEQHSQFARGLTTEAVEPMTKHAQDIESKLSKYREREKKAAHDLKELQKQYYHTRSHTNKLLKRMKKEHAILQEDKNRTPQKKPLGLFKKIARRATTSGRSASRADTPTNERAANSADKFRTAVEVVNNGLTKYYEEIVPHIFHVAEHVERARLSYIKNKLQRVAQLKAAAHALEGEGVATLERVPRELSEDQAIDSFIRTCMKQKSPDALFVNKDSSHLYEVLEYDLPVTPEDLRAGRHEPQPNSVFGATLEHCMELQKDDPSCASLFIPRIVDVCIRGVEEKEGLQAEGIFRVSAASSELQQVIKQFDSGDYSLSQPGPHVYAATLKHWLRNLLDPLIPDSLYAGCIELVKDSAESSKELTKKDFRSVFASVGKVNLQVIHIIAQLCIKITSEENAKTNRMNMSNLAIVFAPCLLRNPSDDPSELMAAAKYEKKFTERLFIAATEGGYSTGARNF